ncbi:hypothetical protein [Streptosporangium sp. NPDC049046]|uniref:hypothetical protein n=1 Tax=Streptosporangium sp. NPDC049046 TaxID=3155031 RepID=UPI00344370CE
MGDVTLRVLTRGRRGGSRVVKVAWPMAPTRSVPSVITPVAWRTWSRAVWKAMVKEQRSGSVPGRDSAASTITVRSSW